MTGGSPIPALALGVPGDGGTVVLVGVMTIQRVVPERDLINNHPHIPVGAFLMFAIGTAGTPAFARILPMPEPLMMEMILGSPSSTDSWSAEVLSTSSSS